MRINIPPGTVLSDKYNILEHIGKGGMADVYVAYQESLHRKVAIKVISPEFIDSLETDDLERYISRFHREARIAAQIQHPNVIRILDHGQQSRQIGEKPGRLDYIVMEYIPGRTLRDTMSESGIEDEIEIRRWLRRYMHPILEGVAEIHNKGIIHRDIKPENFLMRHDTPILSDFGLSRIYSLKPITTSFENVFGTAQYIAPEQYYNFKFTREPADIYGLTKIIYEMVEGKIAGNETNFKQVMLSNKSTRFLDKLNNLILDGTNDDPRKRIRSAQDLRTRIDYLLSDELDLDEREKSHSEIDNINLKKKNILTYALLGFILSGISLFAILSFIFDKKTEINPLKEYPSKNRAPVKNRAIDYAVDYSLHDTDIHKKILIADDGAAMHYIPGGEISYPADYGSFGSMTMSVNNFFMSSSPVTNQQYVHFLNKVLLRIKVENGVVGSGIETWIRLGEFIAGYKPIIYKGGRFRVKTAEHSSCAVLRITGFGASAYARHYGKRLPTPEELFFVHAIGINGIPTEQYPFPTPVGNYPMNRYGIRGLNTNLTEWSINYSGAVARYALFGNFPDHRTSTPNMKYVQPNKVLSNGGFRTVLDAK